MTRLAVLLAVLAALPAAAEDAAVADGPRPVVSVILSSATIEGQSFVGTVAAKTEIALGFPLGGMLVARPVDTGDLVARGQVVAQLDPEDFSASVRSAEAALAVAAVNLRSAADARDRAQELAGRGVDATTRIEDAERALAAAEARHDQAAASLEAARKTLADATLVAPQDGVVLQVLTEPGATVTAGQAIVTLAGADAREVVIDLSEDDVGSFDPGAGFEVELIVSPGVTARAVLARIERVAERTTRTRRLHLTLDETAAGGFRLGTLVSVTPATEHDAALSLPMSAILAPDTQPAVWRVDRTSDTVSAQPVMLGEAFGGRVRIVDGLEPGDEIVIKGIHSLEEGQTVGPRVALP